MRPHHGIDDLARPVLHRRRRVDVYADAATSRMLMSRFGYCFVQPAGSEYPPISTCMSSSRRAASHSGTRRADRGAAFRQCMAISRRLIRFGDVAYSSDLNDMPDDSVAALAGLDVDRGRAALHAAPSHFSFADRARLDRALKPRRAILTNMHMDIDFETVRAQAPPNVEPAYDGMRSALKRVSHA